LVGHPWNPLFTQFRNLRQSLGLLGRGISPWQGHYLTQTQNKRKKKSMPWVVFEPTIPGFERAKTCHALDRAATVIGYERIVACEAYTSRRGDGVGWHWLDCNWVPQPTRIAVVSRPVGALCQMVTCS
jgi:hypothetical protein